MTRTEIEILAARHALVHRLAADIRDLLDKAKGELDDTADPDEIEAEILELVTGGE